MVEEDAHVGVTVSVVDWLLDSDEPGIVAQAKRDLLDEQAPPEAARVLEGPKVRTLLANQQADGGFGINVYAKWGGAHWRLVSWSSASRPANRTVSRPRRPSSPGSPARVIATASRSSAG